MATSRFFLRLLLAACFTSPAYAINCPPTTQLLTPSQMESEVAEVTVIDHVTLEKGDPRNPSDLFAVSAVAVQVNEIYQGETLEAGVVLITKLNWDCNVIIDHLPIGGRYIFALEPTQQGTFVAPSTVEVPAVNNGNLQIITDYECQGELGCTAIRETISLDHFEIVQEAYFTGVRAGAKSESRKLPYFKFDSGVLSMPTVNLFPDQSALSSQEQPSGVVEAELRLISGENGNLLFSIERLGSK